MNDHNEYCATNFNSIDECDCERGQVRGLRSKLAIAVEALDEVCKYGCGILCEEADGDHHHLCPQRIAKEALAKIH